jgi:hypothetical protein
MDHDCKRWKLAKPLQTLGKYQLNPKENRSKNSVFCLEGSCSIQLSYGRNLKSSGNQMGLHPKPKFAQKGVIVSNSGDERADPAGA